MGIKPVWIGPVPSGSRSIAGIRTTGEMLEWKSPQPDR
jgi:hypothetical protein